MIKQMQLHPGLSALVETWVMFLPAIPAYLWIWPNLEGILSDRAIQILVYAYFLTGTLFIGLRRWNLQQLGLNRQGIGSALVAGLMILLGRSLVILSLSWSVSMPGFGLSLLLGEAVYYFAIVGLVEELVFRGLVYRALEDWRGTRWAIWVSSFAFGLWHLNGGIMIIIATALYGLIFALVRWRTGSILGLILTHGAIDYFGMLMLPNLDVLSLGRPGIPYPGMLMAGLVLILLTPVVLWLFYPQVNRFASRHGV